jgi:hypothetical protein
MVADAAPALRTLLYRYFFFDWLFRDVTRGSRLERAAAWRHNRGQARWLPTYMRRWLVCTLVLYGIGCFVELALGAAVAATFFHVPRALGASLNAVTALTWFGLRRLPAPC